jgi:predicted transport protein
MSIYLQNLNADITATINRGGITFRKGSNVIDMICQKSARGFVMHFVDGHKPERTIINAKSAAEVQKKLAPVVHDLFRLSSPSLKGMI